MKVLWERWRSDERGQSVVLVALLLTVLMAGMALAIDVGRAYSLRVHAQNAADAAALAGAEYLPDEATATTWAVDTAAANGFTLDPATQVVFSCAGPSCAADATPPVNQIQVTIQKTISNYFAPVIGFPTTTITVESTALANTTMPSFAPMPNGAYYGGLMPWGLCEASLPPPTPTVSPYTTTYSMNPTDDPTLTMKEGSSGTSATDICNGSGNFAPVDLDYNKSGGCVSGSKQYEHDIAFGSPTEHYVGDQLCTETGNLVGGTDSGLAQLLSNCQQATGTTCGMIGIIVPIITGQENGKSQVTIVGFTLAVLYGSTITSITSNDNTFNAQVAAYYLPPNPTAAGDCNPATQSLPCPPPASWDTTQGLLTQ